MGSIAARTMRPRREGCWDGFQVSDGGSAHRDALARGGRACADKLDVAASNTWWGQVPIMLAIDKGFFKEQGIDTELKNIPASGDRIAALTAGSVAFSNLGRIAAIVEMARGNQSFYFFANIDDSPGNEGCWARPGFTSFKSLKGKKVAANTSAQITMNGLLANEGMSRAGYPVRQSAGRRDGWRDGQGRRRCRVRLAAAAR